VDQTARGGAAGVLRGDRHVPRRAWHPAVAGAGVRHAGHLAGLRVGGGVQPPDRPAHRQADGAHRTAAAGHLKPWQVLVFAIAIGIVSMLVLALLVNGLTAWLTFAGLIGYALVYTAYLKRATPQNIVIGGLAGAIPPVLGWTAVTGSLHPFALQLCLIIFVWTPPHFWALAIFRREDYARWQVLFYTVLLVLVTLLPAITGYSGWLYLGGALVLGAGFLYYAIRLLNPPDEFFAMRVFKY